MTVALALIVWFTRFLPEAVFAATAGFLLVVAGLAAALAAASVFLVPARRFQARLFLTRDTGERGVFRVADADQVRQSVPTVLVMVVCLAVAALGAAVR
jgi:multisubunit Na+/H+ antiporter MnhB subunit